ncbi:MAG TPA: SGNH/GDSL hydrolase family protein [Ilumatobacteraceae bacterium]|nr:SGNH/GDSL hydrolase family protein [Ilumatobacteraceae bacterium]
MPLSGAPASAVPTNKVLILDATVTGGGTSVEAEAVRALGLEPEVVSAATWSTFTTSVFSTYRAIVLGDPTCGNTPPAVVANTSLVWGPAVNGNVIIDGTDPVFHKAQGGLQLSRSAIAFAVADVNRTGMYTSLSCYFHDTAPTTPVPMLDGLAPGGFNVSGVGCHNDAHIVADHPALDGLTDISLSNWNCSVHEGFAAWPASFQPLAIAEGVGSYIAADGTVGFPYILARSASLELPTNPPNQSGGGVADGRFVYAALGDSYSAGVGTQHQRTDKAQDPCYRSGTAYPFVIANRLFELEDAGGQPVDFTFAACGGADIRHVRSNGQFQWSSAWALTPTPDRPQIDSVPANADLITIGIGGNDVGFSGIGSYCFAVADCQSKLSSAGLGIDPIARLVDALEDDLVDTYIALRLRAPHATIVAIGYPTLLSNYSNGKRFSCATGYSQIEKDEVGWIQGLNTRLNGAISRAAATAGIRFFDLAAHESGGESHGMCGSPAYINLPQLTGGDTDNALHPTAAGHAAYGQAILDAGVIALPRNPDATGTRPASVQGPPLKIEFIKDGVESKPADGDAVAGVSSGSIAKCLLERAASTCEYGVRVVNAQSGAEWRAWVYSDPQLLASGTVGADGTISVTLQVPSTAGGGTHTILVETTSALGETTIFVLPVQLVDYIALPAPARVLDTRVGSSTIDGAFAGSGPLAAGQILELDVAGRAGVPDDAASVVMNVTAVDAQGWGFATVFPCGEALPTASNLNYVAAQTTPNSVISRVGANGKVCVYTYAPSEFLVDITGFTL